MATAVKALTIAIGAVAGVIVLGVCLVFLAAGLPWDLLLVAPCVAAALLVGVLWVKADGRLSERLGSDAPTPGPHPRRSWRRLLVFGAAGLAVAVLLWTTLTPPGRTSFKTVLFLPNVIPDAPLRPLGWATRSPRRVPVTFSDDRSTWEADLYLPGTRAPHPAIIVTLGVTPAGRDDPRVVHLGEGLARMGLIALTPYSDNLINKAVTPREIDFLVSGFQYLQGRADVDAKHVGFIGVCVGSSLALLAAEDPRINDRVDFVNFFGGYFNAAQFLEEVATHSYTDEGRRVPWTPDPLPQEVMKLEVIRQLPDAAEGQFLTAVLVEGQPADPERVAALSAPGRLVYGLFTEKDTGQIDRLLKELRPYLGEWLTELSPDRGLANLHARIYLMVDRSDDLIPYVETRALARALKGRYERYSEFSIFSHVDLNKLSNPLRSGPQLWRLYRHIDAIFQDLL